MILYRIPHNCKNCYVQHPDWKQTSPRDYTLRLGDLYPSELPIPPVELSETCEFCGYKMTGAIKLLPYPKLPERLYIVRIEN